MDLKKRVYMRRKFNDLNINDNNTEKVNRTQDEVRLYNRLYYAYVLRHSQDYKHYTKEYHTRNREVYKYKYKQETLENMNKMRKIKIVELRVKIEFPSEENKFIVEI